MPSALQSRACFLVQVLSLAVLVVSASTQGTAQATAPTSKPQPRITQAIDEAKLTTLRGNVHPLLRGASDQGLVAGEVRAERMLLVLKRSPEQEAVLEKFIEAQHTPGSASFHQWLTPEEFGAQFGVAAEDIAKVTDWLRSQGFTVNRVANGLTIIEFSGTVAQVQRAFHTEIHSYSVNGEPHVANNSEPQIPAALEPVVAGVASLHDFRKQPAIRRIGPAPQFTSGANHYFAPGDAWTIYNITPQITAGINGTGQSIAIVGRSDVNQSDFNLFRTTYGLVTPTYTGTLTQVIDGVDPGTVPGDQDENTLDVEWASVAAPDASVILVVSGTTLFTDGVDLSSVYIINNNLAGVMSKSYGACEFFLGNAQNQLELAVNQQAAAQGITSLVSSGDNGSASCDIQAASGDPNNPSVAHFGLQVSGVASTPYNVAVGGNLFYNEASSWNSSNGATPLPGTSAKGYISEQPWNESCSPTVCGNAKAVLWAGSGGKSSCAVQTGGGVCTSGYAKPSWQSVFGVPSDGVRDVPDVSFTAAGHDGYTVVENGSGFIFSGTSASTPFFAGIMALVNQKTGARQGQANWVLYKLAANEYGTPGSPNTANLTACNSDSTPASGNSCIFYDDTKGNNAVPCAGGSPNCSSATPGTFGTLTGYSAGQGYDLASGLGSVNVNNLINHWSDVTRTSTNTTIQLSSSSFAHGTAVTATIHVTGSGGTPTGDVAIIANSLGTGTVTLNGPTPGFVTLTSGSFTGPVNGFPAGSYMVTAQYGGDGTFAPSTSTGFAVTVTKENSVLAYQLYAFDPLTGGFLACTPSSPACSVPSSLPYGAWLDFTVGALGVSGVGTATGTISIPALSTTDPLNSFGYADFSSWCCFPTGLNSYPDSYSGDSNFNAGGGNINFTVVPSNTSMILASNATSLTGSGWVTLTGTVGTDAARYAVAPSSVNFFVGGSQVGSVAGTFGLNLFGLVTSTATFPLTSAKLAVGRNSVTAQFPGDTNYNASAVSPAVLITRQPNAFLGDFDGDGKADIVWRNFLTGENYQWLMNGTTIVTSSSLTQIADTNWQIVAIGDFNGDGKADIFWRNMQTGATYVWLMNGSTITSNGPLQVISDLNWQVVGAGDFNGDGKADILWHNASTGENYLWLMNGLSVSSSGALPTISDLNWQIVGIGDFNGDGKADIFWRNLSTGENYMWLMNGMSVASNGALPQISDQNWQIP